MITTVQVIFYSMYGRIHRLAEAVTRGVSEVRDVKAELFRVPELLPQDLLEKSGVKAKQQAYDHIPVIKIEQLADADAYLFGTPNRFDTVCAQMRHFFDQLRGTGLKQALIGKIGGIFTGTGTSSGLEANLQGYLFNLGMLVAGTPPVSSRDSSDMMPREAATVCGGMPTAIDLERARLQGRQIAQLARAVKCGRSL